MIDVNYDIAIDYSDCRWVLDCTTSDIATCDALPVGIPLDILEQAVFHRTPIYKDNGIRFEVPKNRRRTKVDQIQLKKTESQHYII